MITAKQVVKDFVNAQNDMSEFAGQVGVTRQTLYNLLNGENLSSELIGKMMKKFYDNKVLILKSTMILLKILGVFDRKRML